MYAYALFRENKLHESRNVLSTLVRESSGSSDAMKDTIDFARDLANHIDGIETSVKEESQNDRQCTEEEEVVPDTLWSQWKRDYLKRHEMYVHSLISLTRNKSTRTPTLEHQHSNTNTRTPT
jgi:hypothetical protein